MEQQVAEIARVERLQPRLIRRVELAAAAVGVALALARLDVGGDEALVLPLVDQPGELARGPAFLVEVGGEDELLEQAELVVGVEDGEIGVQPDQLGMAAQHLRADRVERAEPRHPLDHVADESCATRSRISRAALLVKVTERISRGPAPFACRAGARGGR